MSRRSPKKNPRFLFLAIFLGMGVTAFAEPPKSPELLHWADPNQTNVTAMGDVSTRFIFKVTNVSSHDVTVDDLKPSCGCTVAQLPSNPWILKPHQKDQFEALVDLRGKTGKLFKTIQVLSSNAPATLQLAVDIQPGTNKLSAEMANRIWGQQVAATDHQAVFKKDCVKCHLVPAFGKNGEQLYVVACGICHDAKHRADMVPDLRSIKSEISPDYWRNWVTYGKEHTLMPGFTSTLGGPLTDAQIDSLVVFLGKVFPRPVSTNAVNFNHPDHAKN